MLFIKIFVLLWIVIVRINYIYDNNRYNLGVLGFIYPGNLSKCSGDIFQFPRPKPRIPRPKPRIPSPKNPTVSL